MKSPRTPAPNVIFALFLSADASAAVTGPGAAFREGAEDGRSGRATVAGPAADGDAHEESPGEDGTPAEETPAVGREEGEGDPQAEEEMDEGEPAQGPAAGVAMRMDDTSERSAAGQSCPPASPHRKATAPSPTGEASS